MAIEKYAKTCAKNVSGNSLVCIAEVASITAVTVTTGEISAITGTTPFKEVDADIDTILREQEGEGIGNGANIKYTHRITMKFSKLSTGLNTLRDSLADASPCGMAVITLDGNGQAWLTGYSEADGLNRGLMLKGDSDKSGAAPADEDGSLADIILERDSGYLDFPFDSTLNALIVAGTSTIIDWN